MSAGTVIAGGVVSTTVTRKLALAELPLASVAVTVTTTVPSANVEPDDALTVTSGSGLTPSVASSRS